MHNAVRYGYKNYFLLLAYNTKINLNIIKVYFRSLIEKCNSYTIYIPQRKMHSIFQVFISVNFKD